MSTVWATTTLLSKEWNLRGIQGLPIYEYGEEKTVPLRARLLSVTRSIWPDKLVSPRFTYLREENGYRLVVVLDGLGEGDDIDCPPNAQLQQWIDLIQSTFEGETIAFSTVEDAVGVPLWYQQMILRFKSLGGIGHVGTEPALGDDKRGAFLHWYVPYHQYDAGLEPRVLTIMQRLYQAGAVMVPTSYAEEKGWIVDDTLGAWSLAHPEDSPSPQTTLRSLTIHGV